MNLPYVTTLQLVARLQFIAIFLLFYLIIIIHFVFFPSLIKMIIAIRTYSDII
jgi:hypothetical protein